jgi:signal transduction histidine kinase
MASDREAELLRQQAVLAQFGEFALRSDDLDDILHQACHLVGQACGTGFAKVMEFQPDGVTLLVRAGIGWPEGIVGQVTVRADKASSEGYAVATGKPVISQDIATEHRFTCPDFLRAAGIRALVNVIILGPDGRRPYGLLQVDSTCPRAFTEADADFLRSYANLLAAAVNRLRMVAVSQEALARTREDLEMLVANRTAELQQALETLHRESTERLQAEERLRQSEKFKAIGQLTGGIAHDFNNLLQALTSSLSMIRLRLQQGQAADIPGYIERAESSATRAASLTSCLLTFGRRQTLAPEPVSLDRIARGMEDMIRRTVGPAVQVDLKLAEGNWLVMCDPNQMQGALLNLCVNARDAMPDGGWLTVETQEIVLTQPDLADFEDTAPGRYATIAVSDTGAGMHRDVVAHVFEPFFTTKPLGQGAGLGLSQIYGFVRQSGGIVQIESTPGKGTTVRLCLPFHEHSTDSHGVPAPFAGKTVLLVEDEEDVRELTAEQLRNLGYRVLEAECGPAALRLVEAGAQIDLLVSDVGLPGGMNGKQVAEMMRRHHPALPVILITGYAGGDPLPGLDVLRKPFDFMRLAEAVRAGLQEVKR